MVLTHFMPRSPTDNISGALSSLIGCLLLGGFEMLVLKIFVLG